MQIQQLAHRETPIPYHNCTGNTLHTMMCAARPDNLLGYKDGWAAETTGCKDGWAAESATVTNFVTGLVAKRELARC